jgi:hypothetical protein
MSDIHGTGYGSDHNWKWDITDTFGGEKGTRYYCPDCKQVFVHLYDVTPNIFEAMRERHINEACIRPSDRGQK